MLQDKAALELLEKYKKMQMEYEKQNKDKKKKF